MHKEETYAQNKLRRLTERLTDIETIKNEIEEYSRTTYGMTLSQMNEFVIGITADIDTLTQGAMKFGKTGLDFTNPAQTDKI